MRVAHEGYAAALDLKLEFADACAEQVVELFLLDEPRELGGERRLNLGEFLRGLGDELLLGASDLRFGV